MKIFENMSIEQLERLLVIINIFVMILIILSGFGIYRGIVLLTSGNNGGYLVIIMWSISLIINLSALLK